MEREEEEGMEQSAYININSYKTWPTCRLNYKSLVDIRVAIQLAKEDVFISGSDSF